jgi:hypothetical protein
VSHVTGITRVDNQARSTRTSTKSRSSAKNGMSKTAEAITDAWIVARCTPPAGED